MKPIRKPPRKDWKHIQLYQGVREAISSLPIHFRTETNIAGVMATDLHTLNTVLGATIEEQVVRTMNLLRNTWDPEDRYALFNFVRQAQTFPDVLLRSAASGEILLGIELKGWYLLAKEAEPSLGFQTTAAACAKQDLVVVVPWVLGNVISGSPVLFEPFVESAKFAAEYRNYFWQDVRRTKQDSAINVPEGVTPYPTKSDQILDKPAQDGGGNFGRIARTGLMDQYKAKLDDVPLCGISTVYWRDFLKTFQESTTDESARLALQRLRRRLKRKRQALSASAESALVIVRELERLIDIGSE